MNRSLVLYSHIKKEIGNINSNLRINKNRAKKKLLVVHVDAIEFWNSCQSNETDFLFILSVMTHDLNINI